MSEVWTCSCCLSSFNIFISSVQSVLPFFVATKMTRIRKPTLDKPTPERYVAAELSTVGLQSQTNGYFPHAVMVSSVNPQIPIHPGIYQVNVNVALG